MITVEEVNQAAHWTHVFMVLRGPEDPQTQAIVLRYCKMLNDYRCQRAQG